MTAPAILAARDLSVDFPEGQGRRAVLHDVNIELRRREVLGIVGETGAGKSVLARALMDLVPGGGRISGGRVEFDGTSLAELDDTAKRALRGGRIALIGTSAKSLLDPVERVGTQIARVLRAHRRCSRAEAERAAVGLLGDVGIVDPEGRARAYPHELSGGMAQRVVIAMALVAGPEVVLADDATLGLDATVQVQVLDLLVDRVRKAGASAMLITHDLGVVARYCDRVAVLRDGRVVETQPVGRFMAAAADPYSRELLATARARPTPNIVHRDGNGSVRGRPLLEVQDLRKLFPLPGGDKVVRAVDGVSFSVARGETLALVGESGSGKTTVGQCILRLLPATAGQIRFDGRELLALRERDFRPLRARIQMVFQEPYLALNPRWTALDLVAEPLGLLGPASRRERALKVHELLEMVGLPPEAASAYPHELTAGEQKRIGIARALATSPDLVVFDEPTTALDVRVRAQVIDLVRDIQARTGMSALFITHDLNSVRSLAHSVIVMRHGKIVEAGETEAVFARPAHPYTAALLAAELPVEGQADGAGALAAAVGGNA
ncbi:ATP-binding cassette domain-containing protein [Paracraurococcus lichenis]|uniref:ABC transporter ATP-binding protein n=1 Tax=Paracraurococcus lichenis TaxID=3064888 RepID=A0ABT9ECY9_9PROT|nr:ABC transporter ATP-binding protein [Paracraurococcus sp. LOR1-02]MDO9714076.1 ABC transporter ATP-binding protein [Paracraurococcus sp. LOR1-02]